MEVAGPIWNMDSWGSWMKRWMEGGGGCLLAVFIFFCLAPSGIFFKSEFYYMEFFYFYIWPSPRCCHLNWTIILLASYTHKTSSNWTSSYQMSRLPNFQITIHPITKGPDYLTSSYQTFGNWTSCNWTFCNWTFSKGRFVGVPIIITLVFYTFNCSTVDPVYLPTNPTVLASGLASPPVCDMIVLYILNCSTVDPIYLPTNSTVLASGLTSTSVQYMTWSHFSFILWTALQ
jgi:hypothetical protein